LLLLPLMMLLGPGVRVTEAFEGAKPTSKACFAVETDEPVAEEVSATEDIAVVAFDACSSSQWRAGKSASGNRAV
jgi:hypothetical protein